MDSAQAMPSERFLPEGIADQDITASMISDGLTRLATSEIFKLDQSTRGSGYAPLPAEAYSQLMGELQLLAPDAAAQFSRIIEAQRALIGLTADQAINLSNSTTTHPEPAQSIARDATQKTEALTTQTEPAKPASQDTTQKTEALTAQTEPANPASQDTTQKTEALTTQTEPANPASQDTTQKTEALTTQTEPTNPASQDTTQKTEALTTQTEPTNPASQDTTQKTEALTTQTEPTPTAAPKLTAEQEKQVEDLAFANAKKSREVNTDLVRPTIPGYDQADPFTRGATFHSIASAITTKVLKRMLAEPPEKGRVLVLAGGGGSGKSTVMGDMKSKFDFVFDTTLYSPDAAEKLRQGIEASGRKMTVLYVHRVFPKAFKSILERYYLDKENTGSGRIVPLKAAIEAHLGAQDVILGLKGVDIIVNDNNRGLGEHQEISLEQLRKQRYYGPDEQTSSSDGTSGHGRTDGTRRTLDATSDSRAGGAGETSSRERSRIRLEEEGRRILRDWQELGRLNEREASAFLAGLEEKPQGKKESLPEKSEEPSNYIATKAIFATQEKLQSHYEKHGSEFGSRNESEYLETGIYIINHGYKVTYPYKGEIRIGYAKFFGTTKKGASKFGFVGTNSQGYITTIHTLSGKSFWKLINEDSSQKNLRPQQ
jgi:chemotaxis protein histidine kinase CheA